MQAAALSDIGLVRSNNEDAYWCDPGRGIFLIADGIGGYNSGEVAAAICIEIVSAELTVAVDRGLKDEALIGAMSDSFNNASKEIFSKSQTQDENQGMASSLVAGILEPGNCLIAHAGDTRAYLYYAGTLSQMTVDDTPVGIMVKRGYLLPEKARTHAMKNVLLKSIGSKSAVEPNITRFPIKPQERLVLCSDGLWSLVDATMMAAILGNHSDPQAACQTLVETAKKAGGNDNVTVLIAHAE
jgi:PPM family protein phosphatase